MEFLPLSTERLVLDSLVESDVPRIAEICQDPAISKWTTIPSPYTRESAEDFVRMATEPETLALSPTWALRLTGSGELIGVVGITVADGIGEIGFWMDPAQRGRGLMTEAVGAVVDHALSTMGLHRLGWRCAIIDGEANWASARVAWTCGFTFEGIARRSLTDVADEPCDAMVASIVPGDPRTPQAPWNGPTASHPAFPDPRDVEALVRQFHETYNLPIITDGPDADRDRVHMRLGLVAEEFAELVGASYGKRAKEIIEDAFVRARESDDGTRDTVEVADALGDIAYVVYGMALELGIPMTKVLAEIQGSNLSKLGADGRPIYREDGKVLKGPGYYRPDIRSVLGL